MDINLEYYKIFYYVAGSQSITLAAEQLAISQPAVSQAVKHLEQALSCHCLCGRQGRAADQGGGDALFLCAARL